MPIASFAPIQHVLGLIAEQRFVTLVDFAQTQLDRLPWDQSMLTGRGLSTTMLEQSVGDDLPQEDAFAPFCGSWVGGDIHDASRLYSHRWFEARKEGGWLVQRVLMLPACGGPPTLAYNLFGAQASPKIRGVVDGRPYIGYSLPGGGLLWVGEETGGNISVHMESVSASGLLYDICGLVVRKERDGTWCKVARSSWRYHRVEDAAIQPLVSG